MSHAPGAQAEGTIAIDPTNPLRRFIASNESGMTLFGTVSNDGGATWQTRQFATGADGLPAACCDPSAAFDAYGNLYFAYLSTAFRAELLSSTDGGLTFTHVMEFAGQADQPTVVTGPDGKGAASVWVAYQEGGGVESGGVRTGESGALAYRTGEGAWGGDQVW